MLENIATLMAGKAVLVVAHGIRAALPITHRIALERMTRART